MLAFRDFAPKNVSSPTWGNGAGLWEPLGNALTAANEWVRTECIDVVNVETVVIPCQADSPAFAQTTAPATFINGQHWHIHRQFIRIWHRTVASPNHSANES